MERMGIMRKKKRMKPVSVLVVTMLLIMAFIRGEYSQPIMIGVVSIWILVVFGNILLKSTTRFIHLLWKKLDTTKKDLKMKIRNKMIEYWELDTVIESEEAENKKKKVYDFDLSDNPDQFLLWHVNGRITDKLQSAYPKVAWNWLDEDSVVLKAIKSYGTQRISVQGTGLFNQADIRFDKKGKIQFSMLKAVPLENAKKGQNSVDIEEWFHSEAQQELEKIVKDLYSKGHKSFKIKEGGKISVDGKENVIEQSISHFPAKKFWQKIADFLQELNLKASVEKDSIVILLEE